MARMSVLAFGHRTPWLPARIIDFDGNDFPVRQSVQWADQYERLRNLIAIGRNLRAIWDRRRFRRNRIAEQHRRLCNLIGINRNLRGMYGTPRPRRIDEQNGRLRNWIAINRLCRAMYRPKQRTAFASNIEIHQRAHLKVVNS